jgi:hypothetical protein
MSTTETNISAAGDFVEAKLNYLTPDSEKPVSYRYQPPQGVPWRTGTHSSYVVAIHNARPIADRLSLDKEGFKLIHFTSQLADFYDEKEVQAVVYPEVEQILRTITGAPRVFVFDHIVRYAPKAQRSEDGAKEPAKAVHNDYTDYSGAKRVRDLFPHEAEELLKNRFAIINLWKPISGPVLEAPLSVCDARSIAKSDLVVSELRYPHRIGETYALTYAPGHRWYYFPRMRSDEALLIKCFDSEKDGRARFTAHTAFDDPASPPNAPPRESIELRALVFFAPNGGHAHAPKPAGLV